jgi:putative transposon-encoded protein
MDVHSVYHVHLVYSFSAQTPVQEKSIYTMYIELYSNMIRLMKAIITQIESVVTPGNSGHVVVPKAWIGKEAIVTLKKKNKTEGRR